MMKKRALIFALWAVIFSVGLALAGSIDPGAEASRAAPIYLIGGFLGGLISGIGKAIGGVAGVVGKVAGVIPGVGSVVAAGATAVSAVLKGGSVKATTPATATQPASTSYVGSAPPAPGSSGAFGFLSSKFVGIPVWGWLAGAVLGFFWLRKRRG